MQRVSWRDTLRISFLTTLDATRRQASRPTVSSGEEARDPELETCVIHDSMTDLWVVPETGARWQGVKPRSGCCAPPGVWNSSRKVSHFFPILNFFKKIHLFLRFSPFFFQILILGRLFVIIKWKKTKKPEYAPRGLDHGTQKCVGVLFMSR